MSERAEREPSRALSEGDPVGEHVWALGEGHIPGSSTGPEPDMTSHETACILNTGSRAADVRLILYFVDREPVGPYEVAVPPRRTVHLRFNDLDEPEPVPRDTDFSTLIISSQPVVVQHSRLDSRQAENALMTTLAYPVAS